MHRVARRRVVRRYDPDSRTTYGPGAPLGSGGICAASRRSTGDAKDKYSERKRACQCSLPGVRREVGDTYVVLCKPNREARVARYSC